MKLISKLTRFTAVAFLTLGLASCSDDDDAVDDVVVPETNTIADFVASNDDYSSLEAALEVTGLTATLDGTANYTVFAPDNDAFAAFLSDNGFSDLSEVPTDVLTQVLMNHVQSGIITSGDLTTGYIESMAVGSASEENLSMYIDTSDGVMINGVSNVVTADVEVDNGIIHAVDAVIGLPDITTFAMADPTFDTLVAALTREDSYTFVETLMMTSDPAPFTVFAPTNDAFGALLEELEAESLNDISGDVLASVLSYHVVAGANVRSGDLSDGMVVTMLNEDSITVNVGDTVTLTDSSGRTSTVVATDVQANNGVIHVLDMVLLPAM
ncbi:beta-Ig-H3/fasciclin domain-containing protein [Salinimicrobium marinum]|uniref:Beta-Ig-H3/fasciclin domain-containing protein n=1 Tax=Salinimicrobium marinum TaxID=680283 RepID=A0A918SHV8_9FLAO|nr:fasciclin domain-containing protein [Salinimicrobium marinum]GHA43637.1 beta-Ig-H3/fasciclin domain-containing protein [Salinimicrobium marinum]